MSSNTPRTSLPNSTLDTRTCLDLYNRSVIHSIPLYVLFTLYARKINYINVSGPDQPWAHTAIRLSTPPCPYRPPRSSPFRHPRPPSPSLYPYLSSSPPVASQPNNPPPHPPTEYDGWDPF